jgi:hypothetical protein
MFVDAIYHYHSLQGYHGDWRTDETLDALLCHPI